MKKPDWKLWTRDKEECMKWLDKYAKQGVLRKRKDKSGLYLRKTDHNLSFANWVFEKHKDEIPDALNDTYYDWVISAYYYAVYHSALALMSKEGYESKSHSATLCFLIYHHYHLGSALDFEDVELVAESLSREDIEIIGVSKDLRERASYDVHESFEQKLALMVRKQAVEFINKIKVMLR